MAILSLGVCYGSGPSWGKISNWRLWLWGKESVTVSHYTYLFRFVSLILLVWTLRCKLSDPCHHVGGIAFIIIMCILWNARKLTTCFIISVLRYCSYPIVSLQYSSTGDKLLAAAGSAQVDVARLCTIVNELLLPTTGYSARSWWSQDHAMPQGMAVQHWHGPHWCEKHSIHYLFYCSILSTVKSLKFG